MRHISTTTTTLLALNVCFAVGDPCVAQRQPWCHLQKLPSRTAQWSRLYRRRRSWSSWCGSARTAKLASGPSHAHLCLRPPSCVQASLQPLLRSELVLHYRLPASRPRQFRPGMHADWTPPIEGRIRSRRLSFNEELARPLMLTRNPFHFCAIKGYTGLAVFLHNRGLSFDEFGQPITVAAFSGAGVSGDSHWEKTFDVWPADAALLAGSISPLTSPTTPTNRTDCLRIPLGLSSDAVHDLDCGSYRQSGARMLGLLAFVWDVSSASSGEDVAGRAGHRETAQVLRLIQQGVPLTWSRHQHHRFPPQCALNPLLCACNFMLSTRADYPQPCSLSVRTHSDLQ